MTSRLPPSVRYLLASLAIIAAIVTLAPVSRPSGYFRDFNAFYCAGKVISSGKDPYLAEPLGSCERRPRAGWVQSGATNLSLPAPLPPYALAPFVMLSRLPLLTAAWVWSAVLVTAFALIVWSLRKVTNVSSTSLFAIFAIDLYSSMFLGEIATLAVAAIALAMMFLKLGKIFAAALVAAVALIEPHVGLPAVLALFMLVPAARAPLACAGTVLGALSLLLVGKATTIEYVSRVLPGHAMSEITSERQLSLTSIFHLFGASDRVALNAGFVSYYVMVVSGLFVARRFAKNDAHDGLILAAPVALALLGGVFVHVAQMQAALPAALVGFDRTSGTLKKILGASIVMLVIPWVQFTFLGLIFIPLAGLTASFLTSVLLRQTLVVSALAGLATIALVSALVSGIAADPHVPSMALPQLIPGDLAEVNWRLHVAVQGERNRAVFELARIPTWLGIGVIAVALYKLARKQTTALQVANDRNVS